MCRIYTQFIENPGEKAHEPCRQIIYFCLAVRLAINFWRWRTKSVDTLKCYILSVVLEFPALFSAWKFPENVEALS